MYELSLWVIGRAQPDDEGVAHLNLSGDFPSALGPAAPIGMDWDTLNSQPWFNGRNPVNHIGRDEDGNLLLVDGSALPVMSSAVVQDGVSWVGGLPGIKDESLEFYPEPDDVPYVAIVGCGIRAADEAGAVAVAQAIHTSARYRILAAWPKDSDNDPPAQLRGWHFTEPFSPARWTALRNPLVNALGLDAQVVDGWWSVGGEDRTPVEFVRALIGLWKSL